VRYFKKGFWPPRDDSNFVAMRFTPLHPAIPGRLQDDGARQVSWLAGSTLSPVFPRLYCLSDI
jgi:hypothetical protein